MTATRAERYLARQLAAERDAGQLICHCDDPQPEPIPVYDAWQCGRCWRLYRPETVT